MTEIAKIPQIVVFKVPHSTATGVWLVVSLDVEVTSPTRECGSLPRM